MKEITPSRIIISRTDSIGDVVLTFPICHWLREEFPHSELIYLGRDYTRSIIESFTMIDQFISWDDLKNMPKLEQIEQIKRIDADTIIHIFPNKDIAQIAKKLGFKIELVPRIVHSIYYLVMLGLIFREKMLNYTNHN